jgi:hypothetical protein
MAEQITNETKFEWFNSLTFQDVVDCVFKGTIVELRKAVSDIDRGISSMNCSKEPFYKKFNEIKYYRARLTDKTVIEPDTFLKDIKGSKHGFYWCVVDVKMSKNDIKKCNSKEALCTRWWLRVKDHLYFQISDWDYVQVYHITSRDENSYHRDYTDLINRLSCNVYQLKQELEEKKKELNSKREYQKIHESIYEV